MPEDESRNGLRVGGWVPPYSDTSPNGPPSTGSALPRAPQRRALGPDRARPAPSGRHFFLLAAAAALGCAVTAVVALAGSDGGDPAGQQGSVALPRPSYPLFPLEPEETVAVRPKPSVTPSRIVTAPAAATFTSTYTPSPSPSVTPVPSKAVTPPPVSLTVGATVGLESAERPGYRVRHRDYVGRVDPISPASSDVDRADSRFVVRAGRAAANCFSLESVNFPGYYFRHFDFNLRIDRVDGTKLFDEDSTFCTETISGGTALTLRSHNFPDRYVAVNSERLVLSDAAAAAFRPRPPL